MLIVLGCNHRSAPLELRERLAFAEADLPRTLARLTALPAVAGAMVLSTCNRVEILLRTDGPARQAIEEVECLLARERRVTREELDRHVYHRHGRDAVLHLFEVACGLDSMILGEPQILGQVRQAYRVAREAGALDRVLLRLVRQAIASAGRVRATTGISRHAVSIAFAAVELARQIFDDLSRHRVLLLGTGKMAVLVARHLVASGVRAVTVAGRTYDHAVATAERFGGQAVHWADGLALLDEVDIVVTCTAAPGTVLGADDVAAAMRARRGRPLFVIDIAVPRDVDPAVNRLDDVYLYDVDGLQGIVDANLEERRRAAAEARELLAADADLFERWRQSLDVVPTIVSLRNALEATGRTELDRFRRRLGPLSDEQERVLSEMVRALIQKVLHRPTLFLKKTAGTDEGSRTIDVCRAMFALDAERERQAREEGSRGDTGTIGPRRVLRGGKDDRRA
jgi:glutamyl-tRNA reductase